MNSGVDRIDLLNLYLGRRRPNDQFATCNLGTLRVELSVDYDMRVKDIDRKRHWTASATISGVARSDQQSILLHEPDNDGGVWDACELLTFLTGRRVTVDAERDRYSGSLGPPLGQACIGIEVLCAANAAWANREALVQGNLHVPLLLLNAAADSRDFQVVGALHYTALNIVADSWSTTRGPDIDSASRQRLMESVASAVDGAAIGDFCGEYKAVLRARIQQGLGSATDKLITLFRTLDLLPDVLSESAARRVAEVNSCRNALVHTGRIRQLSKRTTEQSKQTAVALTLGVAADVCRLAIGSRLGFTTKTVGSLSQHPQELRQYFETGYWRGKPLGGSEGVVG
ncbi:MAG: hypothetical protein IT454_00925 [Planctomycetes bacterium]|nr:hypothetical protein [Planctomycetota bacterium]